jgi:hypothetical protein
MLYKDKKIQYCSACLLELNYFNKSHLPALVTSTSSVTGFDKLSDRYILNCFQILSLKYWM